MCRHCGGVQPEMTRVDPLVAAKHDAVVAPVDARPLRPRRRPPVAMVVALDDDSETDGETVRMRKRELTLGRRDADWVFPHDQDLSGVHAKIVRESVDDQTWTWTLKDMNSTNGVFVRSSKMKLTSGSRVRIGAVELVATIHDRVWTLTDVEDAAKKYRLDGTGSMSIGTSRDDCHHVIDDETIDPVHAMLRRSADGWVMTDCESRNGIWQRVDEWPLASGDEFILGEQRFCFRLPRHEHPR